MTIHGVIFIKKDKTDLDRYLANMNKITNEWTMRAAKGECVWICSDCCVSFNDGMPNKCPHNDQRCTDIIKRDKLIASNEYSSE